MPRSAGSWSMGALATIVLSGFLTTRVPLGWHIDILMGLSLLVMIYLLHKIAPYELAGNSAPDENYSLTKILRSFKVNWPVSIGLLMGAQLEFSSGDWATIYSKENLSLSPGIATLPYIIFISAMISGRLSIHRLAERYPLEKLVKLGGLVGGSVFVIGLTLSNLLRESSPSLAFICVCLGFLVGGMGSSCLIPLFMNAANRQSDSPGGVVIGQLGVINNILTFLVKAIIAWTAQWLSLPIALLIPGLMLMAVSFFAKVTVAEPN
jgi:fucose permease